MELRIHSARWCLFLLAAVIPGVHLQSNDTSVQPEPSLEAKIYRPVMQPSESIPTPGTYTLRTPLGRLCIKVTMGVEFLVVEKKTWFFNLDPSRVRRSGFCDTNSAHLSLTLPDNAASLQFTFKREKKEFYVTKMTAHLLPMPFCHKCSNKTYAGLLDHEKLFRTENGKSFKCKSDNLLLMSSQLQVKLVPMQMQAFTLPKGQFGKEVECWADYNKRVIPIIIGAVVVCLLIIAVLTFLFIRDRRREGYDTL
ncbi:lysosome-associated membrane glycoprotein 3 [Nelusetta ayraudi]|uniref:lysosome-associated membrane glycoprotein 3 n=1 Tax=Nelusetta ayraudi TaxID=303726 RepID=UPI003F6FCAC5